MGLRAQLAISALLIFVMSFPITRTSAQTTTTGTIEGIVTDRNGAVVPAVTVTVTSPNLIRTQSATTDNEGRYRILNLPPGRYTVTVEATVGFARFAREDVEVNLSKTSSVLIQLEPVGATAIVNISSTAGTTVDTVSNIAGASVSTEQFSNFTTQRTVQSLYTIAPSVARSGLRDPSGRDRDPSVGGSSGLENSYIFDGVNTSDPAYGGSGANLPFEFVQEVEIKTGAYGAEYGLSTGGIFNVLTKSGGNNLTVMSLPTSRPEDSSEKPSIFLLQVLLQMVSLRSTQGSTSAVRSRKISCGSLAPSIRSVVKTLILRRPFTSQ